MVKDLRPGSKGPNPTGLTNINGTLYFAASDSASNDDQLWRTDGTEASTVRVADIMPAGNSTAPYGMTAFKGSVYFFGNINGATDGYGLWKSDGIAGAQEVKRTNSS